MTSPLALLLYERLLPGSALGNKLRDQGYRILHVTDPASITATAAGTVQQVGYNNGYGNLVVINHGFGLQTRYGHLLNSTVKPGSKVSRGDVIGHVRQGTLRLIALGDPLGRQFFPDAPMIGDTVPGFETYAWFGLCGPTGTAPAAIKRWEEAMKATVEDPAIAKRLLDNGMVPAFADSATLNKTIDENRRTYRAVIQAAGIKAE
mgnify:CR=1 FL=1